MCLEEDVNSLVDDDNDSLASEPSVSENEDHDDAGKPMDKFDEDHPSERAEVVELRQSLKQSRNEGKDRLVSET